MSRYDFFVSYRRKSYSDEAHELAKIIGRHGYTTWIETKHFRYDKTSHDEIAEHLRKALNSGAYVIVCEVQGIVAAQVEGSAKRRFT